MLTRNEIIKRLKTQKDELQQKFLLKSIALFGSYARGDETPTSDIDILVEFKSPIGLEIVDLVDALEKMFDGCKVHLISKKGIKPHYLPYIEEDAIYV